MWTNPEILLDLAHQHQHELANQARAHRLAARATRRRRATKSR